MKADELFPYPEGLHLLPTEFVAQYADPAIDTRLPSQRSHMERLTRVIEREGVLVPLTLKVEEGHVHIFDGNHRVAIAQALGIPVLPVLVKFDGIPIRHRGEARDE